MIAVFFGLTAAMLFCAGMFTCLISFQYIPPSPYIPLVICGLMFAGLYSLYKLNIHRLRRERRLGATKRRARRISQSAHKFVVDRMADLRRPLEGQVGIYNLYANGLASEASEYMEISDHCSRFLIRQMERIQFFAEIETGQLKLEKKIFSLRKTIENAIEIATEQSSKQKIEIDISQEWMPDAPDSVEGSEFGLRKILVELLDNSLRHSGDGKVNIRVGLDPDRPAYPRITVTDSGPGLSEKHLTTLRTKLPKEKLMPWQDASDGLGLVLIKRVMEILEGELQADTNKGLGTTISFAVPMKAAFAAVTENQTVEEEGDVDVPGMMKAPNFAV